MGGTGRPTSATIGRWDLSAQPRGDGRHARLQPARYDCAKCMWCNTVARHVTFLNIKNMLNKIFKYVTFLIIKIMLNKVLQIVTLFNIKNMLNKVFKFVTFLNIKIMLNKVFKFVTLFNIKNMLNKVAKYVTFLNIKNMLNKNAHLYKVLAWADVMERTKAQKEEVEYDSEKEQNMADKEEEEDSSDAEEDTSGGKLPDGSKGIKPRPAKTGRAKVTQLIREEVVEEDSDEGEAEAEADEGDAASSEEVEESDREVPGTPETKAPTMSTWSMNSSSGQQVLHTQPVKATVKPAAKPAASPAAKKKKGKQAKTMSALAEKEQRSSTRRK